MDYQGSNNADVLDWRLLKLKDWDSIYGLSGNDTITIGTGTAIGGPGNDIIIGLTKYSTAAYWGSVAGINVDLTAGKIHDGLGGIDSVSDIHTVQGTGYDDYFKGSEKDDTFWSNGGNDTYYGLGGTNSVVYYNLKPSDIKTTFDAPTNTLIISKGTNGVYGTDNLHGIQSISFAGPNSTNETIWVQSLISNIIDKPTTQYNISGYNETLSVGQYSAQNNVWPDGTINNNLLIDKDYWQNIKFARSEIQSNVVMNWSYPKVDPPNHIYAFPTVVWGAGENKLVNESKSYRISELKSLTVDYDFKFSGDTSSFNVSLELYTWSSPITNEFNIKKSEVMVKIYQPWSEESSYVYSDGYLSANVSIQTNQAGAVTPSVGLPTWNYAAFLLKNGTTKGTVDYALILNHLVTKGLVSASDYVAGVALGSEVRQGSGTLSINKFNVNLSTDSDDLLSSNSFSSMIDGAGGTDTVTFPGSALNYRLSFSNNKWTAQEIANTANAKELRNIEKISFADKTVSTETKVAPSYADLPDSLWHFFVVAFNAAPGVEYMNQLGEAYRYGLSIEQIVNIFTTKTQFTGVYPTSLSHAEFGAALVKNVVKASGTEVARQQARDDVKAALDIGWSVGKVVYTVFGNLANKPLTDSMWGDTAKQFQNELAVAKYYTSVMGQSTTDLGTLRDVLSKVTSTTDVSSSDAIVSLVGQSLLTPTV